MDADHRQSLLFFGDIVILRSDTQLSKSSEVIE